MYRMLSFCTPYIIFVSSLLVYFSTVLLADDESEFRAKYPNESTYTEWAALRRMQRLEMKLICIMSYGSFSPITQWSIKVIPHFHRTARYYCSVSRQYNQIRLDLLECEMTTVTPNGEIFNRTFFLAEGTVASQLFKLINGDDLNLVFVGKAELRFSPYFLSWANSLSPQYRPSTSEQVHQPPSPESTDDPFPPVPQLQRGESSHGGLNEPSASARQEPQARDVPIDYSLQQWPSSQVPVPQVQNESQQPDSRNINNTPTSAFHQFSSSRPSISASARQEESQARDVLIDSLQQWPSSQLPVSQVQNESQQLDSGTMNTPASASHPPINLRMQQQTFQSVSPAQSSLQNKQSLHPLGPSASSARPNLVSPKRPTFVQNTYEPFQPKVIHIADLPSPRPPTPREWTLSQPSVSQTSAQEPYVVAAKTERNPFTLNPAPFSPQNLSPGHRSYLQTLFNLSHEADRSNVTADSPPTKSPTPKSWSLSQPFLRVSVEEPRTRDNIALETEQNSRTLDQTSSALRTIFARRRSTDVPTPILHEVITGSQLPVPLTSMELSQSQPVSQAHVEEQHISLPPLLVLPTSMELSQSQPVSQAHVEEQHVSLPPLLVPPTSMELSQSQPVSQAHVEEHVNLPPLLVPPTSMELSQSLPVSQARVIEQHITSNVAPETEQKGASTSGKRSSVSDILNSIPKSMLLDRTLHSLLSRPRPPIESSSLPSTVSPVQIQDPSSSRNLAASETEQNRHATLNRISSAIQQLSSNYSADEVILNSRFTPSTQSQSTVTSNLVTPASQIPSPIEQLALGVGMGESHATVLTTSEDDAMHDFPPSRQTLLIQPDPVAQSPYSRMQPRDTDSAEKDEDAQRPSGSNFRN